MLSVYPTYFIIGLLSKLVIKKANQYIRIGSVTIGSSLIFFILSNFGSWLHDSLVYSWSTLWQTYVQGIPFLKNEIFGTILFSLLVFGYHNLLIKYNILLNLLIRDNTPISTNQLNETVVSDTNETFKNNTLYSIISNYIL